MLQGRLPRERRTVDRQPRERCRGRVDHREPLAGARREPDQRGVELRVLAAEQRQQLTADPDPGELARLTSSELVKWAKVIKAANIRAD